MYSLYSKNNRIGLAVPIHMNGTYAGLMVALQMNKNVICTVLLTTDILKELLYK